MKKRLLTAFLLVIFIFSVNFVKAQSYDPITCNAVIAQKDQVISQLIAFISNKLDSIVKGEIVTATSTNSTTSSTTLANNTPVVITTSLPTSSQPTQNTNSQTNSNIIANSPVPIFSKAKIDFSIVKNYTNGIFDIRISPIFIYDNVGNVTGNYPFTITTNDPNGFQRPGGWISPQSPTVTEFTIPNQTDTCPIHIKDDIYTRVPCYGIYLNVHNHGSSTYNLSVSDLGISTTTTITY